MQTLIVRTLGEYWKYMHVLYFVCLLLMVLFSSQDHAYTESNAYTNYAGLKCKNMWLLFFSGGIPPPIYFGALIDRTCLKWGTKQCGGRGACRLYDANAFRYSKTRLLQRRYLNIKKYIKVLFVLTLHNPQFSFAIIFMVGESKISK